MVKDDALEAGDTAVRAPDPALSDLCDALCWRAVGATIQAFTAVTGAWMPRGLLLTAAVTIATGLSEVKIMEHVPPALAQGGRLLEYVSMEPDTLTAALITRWSPGHSPILAARLWHIAFHNLYSARRKAPPIDTLAAPEIQMQKVSFNLQKPIRQFLPSRLRPTWDRLRVREVVAPFWALPSDVHAVLHTTQIPTAELIPLKFGLLPWSSSICLSGQLTSVPVASPPPVVNTGMWPPDQLRPLLECSIVPLRRVELLHQIEQAGEHSRATAPTIVLLQAGIQDTASPPPLTPPLAMHPTLQRGSKPPVQWDPCLRPPLSPRRRHCTAWTTPP